MQNFWEVLQSFIYVGLNHHQPFPDKCYEILEFIGTELEAKTFMHRINCNFTQVAKKRLEK